MYAITFYSFKGGVGRTMALANIAVQLAQKGRKVLLVDFDLEAPGIPTFPEFAPAIPSPGIVEFISKFRQTGVAPDVREYIYEARFPSPGSVFVMPAGLHDAGYSARLNSIDWQKLYGQENGYLLFEDLKQQWKRAVDPDYVLIDSRTGHSDVEGICTRQLPNAVCILFFPNEQNLQGIQRVAANVRAQNEAMRAVRADIALHFAVSNVPDLDDEEEIVRSLLNRFKRELGYQELSGEVHHYQSLSLLRQEIFSLHRPNSRLSKEYGALCDKVVAGNLEDRDVASRFLKAAVRSIRSESPKALDSLAHVETILAKFPTDPSVLLDVALIYESLGRNTDALAVLGADHEGRTSRFFAVRARLNYRLGNKAEAAADLGQMLDVEQADAVALLEGLSLAKEVDASLLTTVSSSRAVKALSDGEKLFLAEQFGQGASTLEVQLAILSTVVDRRKFAIDIARIAGLALIGLGRFSEAVEQLAKIQPPDIASIFNTAMARWGERGAPDPQLFGEVIASLSTQGRQENMNFQACMAIAYAVQGDVASSEGCITTARSLMRIRPRREFSPWSYTKVAPKDFLAHLSELQAQLRSGQLAPEVIRAKADTATD